MKPADYPIELRPLAAEEGGGYLASFPDLPGCMSDGETAEEAISNAFDAAESWLKTAQEFNDPIPTPGSGGESGRFVTRLPKSMHARLIARARQEGVSMNTLVATLIAEGLVSHEQRR